MIQCLHYNHRKEVKKMEQEFMNKMMEKLDKHSEILDKHSEILEKIEEHLQEHDQHFEKIEEHLQEHDQHFEKIEEHLQEHDQHFEKTDKHLQNHEKCMEDLREIMAAMQRSLVVIEDQVMNKIPALFDGYSANFEKGVELDNRQTKTEQKVDLNSLRISMLEETSKLHTEQLSKLSAN